MSVLSSERSCDSAAPCTENTCSKRVSAFAAKEMMVAECDREPGLFAAFCQKLLCQRGHHDNEDTADVCRVQGGSLCSLCCGGFYPHRSECHRTIMSSSRQMSVHWLPSPSSVEATTCQPGSITRRHTPKCSCGNDFTTADSCEAGVSQVCLRNDNDLVPGGAVRHSDARVSDSLQQRGKQSASMCRVMLADAAYGHATVLDDCMLSDSDAWSGSLSLSRPNSGTNSLERGTSTVQENANEVYESYSDEGEGEDEALWPAVMPLPALPVYDQVGYSLL